jgi:hypothetical protein
MIAALLSAFQTVEKEEAPHTPDLAPRLQAGLTLPEGEVLVAGGFSLPVEGTLAIFAVMGDLKGNSSLLCWDSETLAERVPQTGSQGDVTFPRGIHHVHLSAAGDALIYSDGYSHKRRRNTCQVVDVATQRVWPLTHATEFVPLTMTDLDGAGAGVTVLDIDGEVVTRAVMNDVDLHKLEVGNGLVAVRMRALLASRGKLYHPGPHEPTWLASVRN